MGNLAPNPSFIAVRAAVTARMSLFVGIFFLLSSAHAADYVLSAWRIPEADVRLAWRPAKGDTLVTPAPMQIPIPLELQMHVTGVAAYRDDGTAMPASLIMIGSQAVAAEVVITAPLTGDWQENRASLAMPLEIYLLPNQPSPLPVTAAQRLPLALSADHEKMLTRPFLAAELMALDSNRGGLEFVADLENWQDHQNNPRVVRKTKRRQMLRTHWTTTLVIDAPTSLRLGIDQLENASFLFLNGKPVVGWKEYADQAGDVALSAPLEFSPGCHRLDLFVVQDQPAQITQLYVCPVEQRKPVLISPDQLHTSRLPGAYRVEFREGTVHPGFELSPEQALHFLPRGVRLHQVAVQNLSLPQAAAAAGQVRIRLGGSTDITGGQTAVIPGLTWPDVTLLWPGPDKSVRTLTFPSGFTWRRPSILQTRLLLDEVPIVIMHNERAQLQCRLHALSPSGQKPPAWLGQAGLVWRQFDEQGALLQNGTAEFGPTGQGQIQAGLVPLPGSMEVEAVMNGVPITPPTTIHVLTPDADFSGLRPRGNRLMKNNAAAILIANPPGENHYSATAIEDAWEKPVFICIDESWAATSAPAASLPMAAWINARLPEIEVRHLSVDAARFREARRELHKFGLLGELTNQSGSTVLWAVGRADLAAKIPLPEIEKRLLFLAQASQAQGVNPILMTIPELADVPGETARISALQIKRLGHRLGLPVLDLYSQSQARIADGGGFNDFFQSSDGTLGLSSLNDRGRHFFYTLISETLNSNPPGRTRPRAAAADKANQGPL